MVRAAAKNFTSVVVLTDPADYGEVIAELQQSGQVSQRMRKRLAAKAFRHVSEYDKLIADYLGAPQVEQRSAAAGSDEIGGTGAEVVRDELSREMTLQLTQVQALRYGENPHQEAALYRDNLPVEGATLVGSLKQLRGPELSYNNLLDADAALAIARDYIMPAVAIVKHAGPCGIACGASEEELATIFERALASDPVSAFGGIVGVNREVDAAMAEVLAKTRFDLLVAPSFSEEAMDLLARKKTLRLVAVPDSNGERRDSSFTSRLAFRQISGGFLVQGQDMTDNELPMQPVTLRHPTLEEIADMIFAWRAVKHVRSNAIVLARKMATVGIGGGQPSRVDAVKIAVERAGDKARGAVLASDAFFPFPDGLEIAAEAGITAVIQPGGSVKDDAVIEAADIAGLAMVFTGKRHFRH